MLWSFQVAVSEPDFLGDPAAEAALTVVRSAGGEGAVKLLWQLEHRAVNDLSPLNGTIVFAQVQH